MKGKKSLCIIMSLALMIALSSCSENEANNFSQNANTSPETSKAIISEEDDVSIIDSSSEDNDNSQNFVSEMDNSYDLSDNDDNSIISEPDNSSDVSVPDDNSDYSVLDDSSNVSAPDDTSDVSVPNDNSDVSEPDDMSDIPEPDTSVDTPSVNDKNSVTDILNSVLRNDNITSLNTIMTSIVKNHLNGQDVLYIRSFSAVGSKLFDLSISETSVIDSAICVEPYEGPIEYCCYLIKLNEGTDKEKIKSEIFSSLDKNRWGCITAEKAIVIDSGNVILALMASEAETDAYVEAFKEVMGTAGTVLSK